MRTASARDRIGTPSCDSMLLMSTSTSSPRLTVSSPASWNSSMGTAPSDLKPKSMTTERSVTRSEEHTSELQSHSDLHSFPTRRSSDLVAALDGQLAGLLELLDGDGALRLEAEVDDDRALGDADHGAAHDRAFLIGGLLLLVLVEHRAEVEGVAATTAAWLVVVLFGGRSRGRLWGRLLRC